MKPPVLIIEDAGHYLRVTTRSYVEGVVKNEKMPARIAYLKAQYRLERTLESMYPFLRFRVINIPWFKGQQDHHLGQECAATQVWVCGGRDEHGMERPVTWSGFAFRWPVTPQTKEILRDLSDKARQAQAADNFFCSFCQQVYHKDHLGFAAVSDVRCVDCASDQWLSGAHGFMRSLKDTS